jgi:antitoxin ChpS
MRTTIRKIGNSAGTIIPAGLLKKLGIAQGDFINIDDDGENIIISAANKRPTYNLDTLLDKCDENAPDDEAAQAWDNSPAVGQEVW